MTGQELKSKRTAYGIPGHAVCGRAGNFDRSRLSLIENGLVDGRPDELQRITAAIDDIIRTRQRVERLAAEEGLCLSGVRLTLKPAEGFTVVAKEPAV